MALERLEEAYRNLLNYNPPTPSQVKAADDLGKSAKEEFSRLVSDFAVALAEEAPKKIRILEKRAMTVAAYKPASPFRKALKAFQELVDRTLPDTQYFHFCRDVSYPPKEVVFQIFRIDILPKRWVNL